METQLTLALYGKSRRRQGWLLFAALLAVLTAMVASVAGLNSAFAHTASVKGSATCESDGSYSIAWEIKSDNNKYMFLDSVSTDAGTTNMGDFAPNPVNNKGTIEGTTTGVPGNATSVTLSAQVDWQANADRTGDHYGPGNPTGELKLKGDCLAVGNIQVHKYLPKDNSADSAPWENQGKGQGLWTFAIFDVDPDANPGATPIATFNQLGTNSPDVPQVELWLQETDPAGYNFFGFFVPDGDGDSGNDKCNQQPLDGSTLVQSTLHLPASIWQTKGNKTGLFHVCAYNKPGAVASDGKVIVKKVGPTITGDLANISFSGTVTKNGGGHDGDWTAKVGGDADTTNFGLADGDYQVAEDNMPMTVTGGKIQFVGFQEVDGDDGSCPAPTADNYKDDGLVSIDDDAKTVCVLNKFVADPPACVDYTYNDAAIKNFITNTVNADGTASATLSANFDGCDLPKVRFSLYELTGSSWNNYSNWPGQVHLKTESKELVKGQAVSFDLRPFEVCNYQLDLYLTNDPDLSDDSNMGTGEVATPNGIHRPAPHHSPAPNVLLNGGSGKAWWVEQGNRCITVVKLVDAGSPYGGAFTLTAGGLDIPTGDLDPGQSYSETKVFKAANPDTGVNVNELLPLGWLNADGFPKFEHEQGGQLISSGALTGAGVTITAGGDSKVTIINKSLIPPRTIEVCKVWELSNDDITDPDATFTITSDQGHSVGLTVSEGESEPVCDTIEVDYDAAGVLISELLPAGFTSKTGEGYPKYVVDYATASDVAASGSSVTVDLDHCAIAFDGQVERFLQLAQSIVAVPSCTVTFYNKDGGETLPTGSLRIEKYLDLNGDGDASDLGEGPLVGWNMTVKGAGIDGTFPTADLDLNDLFAEAAISFDGLDSGEKYDVTEETRAGYVLTGVRIDFAAVALGASKTMTIPEGGTTVIQYFNQPRTGIKVNKTEISLAHPGGAAGAGWSFTLSGCGIVPQVAATNAAGQAQFDNLPLAVNCTYIVTETQKAGWSAINPAQVANPVTPGGYATLSFTNVKIEVCTNCRTVETPTPTATPEKPAATPTPTEEPKVEDPTATPTPVDETRGERTPGATPIAPSTGYGLLGGQTGGTNLLLIAAGLMALSGGTVVLAMARKRR